MIYRVRVRYTDFYFAFAENAMRFAQMAAEHYVPDSSTDTCDVIITVIREEDDKA